MSSGLEARQARAGWLFSSPALLLIAVFFFVPVIAGLVLSLTDFDLYSIADLSNARFIGFRNYQRLLVDQKLVRAPGVFRSVLFAPVVTTLVAVAIVWRYLYHPRYGLLNYL